MKEKKVFKRIISYFMVLTLLCGYFNIDIKEIGADTLQDNTTIYFVDNTVEGWISNDNAIIQLVDNTNGHNGYYMTKVEENIWSAEVPETAYNITFNRVNSSKDTQWNSWSAGGRALNNAYYADGSEYGHWENIDELQTENYFHAGDVVYVDLTEFSAWKNAEAKIYVNFSDAEKVNGNDIDITNADKTIYNPSEIDYEESENIYAYIVSKKDEGKDVLRFWRGNDSTLWNCSEKLTYTDFKNGKNTIKVTNWNSTGSIESRDYEVSLVADKDGDDVPDIFEALYGLDKDASDTDNDGLSDYDEVVSVGTNPLVYDSVIVGTADGNLDLDEDGIINIDEISYGTNPNLKDTDSDDINDFEEINIYYTNPVLSDTDNDKIADGDELVLGFNPLLADTNGNGIIDGDEYVWQSVDVDRIEAEVSADNIATPVMISVSSRGNVNKNIKVSEYNNYLKGSERSYVGKAINIENSDMESGHIEFEIASSYSVTNYEVSGSSTNGLLICYNDGETTHPLDTTYDEGTRRLSADISKDGIYFIINVIDWIKSFGLDVNDIEKLDETMAVAAIDMDMDSDSEVNISNVKIQGQADIVFIVDTTGSMGSYITNVKNNLNAFVDRITAAGITPNFALVEYRDITCDGMDSTNIKKNGNNTNWYNNINDFKMQISNLGIAGGGDTPETAIDALEMARNLDMRSSAQKFFILVTDAGYKINNRYGIESVDILVDNLKKDGINVSVVSGSQYSSVYSSIYEETNGIFAEIYGNFTDKLLRIAQLIENETNDGYWIALNGLIPRVVKLDEKPSANGTADTDGDSIPDKEELDLKTKAYDIRIFLNALGFNFKINTAIPLYNYYSDPTKEDTDNDGLYDGRARYVNGELVAPKDYQPLEKNGNKKIWTEHINYKSITEVPDEYDKDAWSSLSGFNKNVADKMVECLLMLRDVVDDNKDKIRKAILWVKKKCEGDTVLGAYILNFIYDDQNVAYHSQPDTWQRSFGYNDFYDEVFKIGSYMDFGKLIDEDKNYALWMWKGDYWNLQSGTEIGLYEYNDKYSGTEQYDVVDFEVPMQLYLYYDDGDESYDNIFGWEPDEKQWWITGFNPRYKEANPKKMTTIGKVDLSEHKDVYKALKNSNLYYNIVKNNVLFDDESNIIWIIWS